MLNTHATLAVNLKPRSVRRNTVHTAHPPECPTASPHTPRSTRQKGAAGHPPSQSEMWNLPNPTHPQPRDSLKSLTRRPSTRYERAWSRSGHTIAIKYSFTENKGTGWGLPTEKFTQLVVQTLLYHASGTTNIAPTMQHPTHGFPTSKSGSEIANETHTATLSAYRILSPTTSQAYVQQTHLAKSGAFALRRNIRRSSDQLDDAVVM